MKKITMPILILAIFSAFTLAGFAMAADMDSNVSTESLTSENETIQINETANVINIMENSNETALVEMMIGEEQRKSAIRFSFVDMISPSIVIILVVISFVYIRRSVKQKQVCGKNKI